MFAPNFLPRSRSLAIALAWLIAVAASPTMFAAESRPNIIVILADDLGWAELGCYGQQKIKTPNIDRMAAEGQRWTQFYAGAPVCSPSRNVLLTGRHTGGCNVQDLKRQNPQETEDHLGGDWPMDAHQYTIHMALKKAGYATSAFGKWGMGEYGTTGAPDKKGVDYFFGYTDHRVCHSFYPPFLWRNGEKVPLNNPGIPGHAKQPDGEVNDATYTGQKHASVAIMEEALKWLDAQAAPAKAGQPFFMYLCPLEAHVAMQPPREWVEKYPVEWDTEPYRGLKSYLPHSRPHAAYAATISYLDDHVGRVLAKLKEKGLDENTLVIFTSDNGTTHDVGGVDHGFFTSVADLRGLKGSMFEGGIRVPSIVRWLGKVAAGKVITQPAYSADLMPTLCALTGADAGRTYGENLLPIVMGNTETLATRRPLVWTGGGYGGQVAVRIGDMKAIRRELYKSEPLNWEVYDLAADHAESTDLAAKRWDIIDAANAVLKVEYLRAAGYPELNIFTPEGPRTAKPQATTAWEKIFQSLDANADGTLTFEEWKNSPKARANTANQASIFAGLDTDGDKTISREEFAAQWKN